MCIQTGNNPPNKQTLNELQTTMSNSTSDVAEFATDELLTIERGLMKKEAPDGVYPLKGYIKGGLLEKLIGQMLTALELPTTTKVTKAFYKGGYKKLIYPSLVRDKDRAILIFPELELDITDRWEKLNKKVELSLDGSGRYSVYIITGNDEESILKFPIYTKAQEKGKEVQPLKLQKKFSFLLEVLAQKVYDVDSLADGKYQIDKIETGNNNVAYLVGDYRPYRIWQNQVDNIKESMEKKGKAFLVVDGKRDGKNGIPVANFFIEGYQRAQKLKYFWLDYVAPDKSAGLPDSTVVLPEAKIFPVVNISRDDNNWFVFVGTPDNKVKAIEVNAALKRTLEAQLATAEDCVSNGGDGVSLMFKAISPMTLKPGEDETKKKYTIDVRFFVHPSPVAENVEADSNNEFLDF